MNKEKDFKALIIDDNNLHIETMGYSLEKLGWKEDNICPKNSEINSLLEYIKNARNNANAICNKIRNSIIENDIDVLFLDLQLKEDEQAGDTTGEKIVELLTYSSDTRMNRIPIVMVSKFEKDKINQGIPTLSTLKYLKKPESSFSRDIFINLLKEDDFYTDLIDIYIPNYQKFKNNVDIWKDLSEILSTTQDTNSRVKSIEIISKMIAKTLPEIADKEVAKKIIKEWEDNDEFKDIIGDYFPKKPKALYDFLNIIVDNLKDNGPKEISVFIYKKTLKHILEEADADKDKDTSVIKMKVAVFFVEKIGKALIKLALKQYSI
jgi:CheY-like chemotaxis protein